MSDPMMIEGCVLVAVVVALILVIITQQRLINRYEQFRQESGRVLSDMAEALGDHERRLTAAGYPPGRTVPNTTYPQWTPRDTPARVIP